MTKFKFLPPFTYRTPLDPRAQEWAKHVPEELRNDEPLMTFLLRLAPLFYKTDPTMTGCYNPLYKIVELLGAERLEYWMLQKIKEYYGWDIIRYLTQNGIASNYVGYDCSDAASLKSALLPRNNCTDSQTLRNILSNVI